MNRIVAGHIGNRLGGAFEEDLGASHDWYKRHGLALIEKLPVETIPCPKSELAPHVRSSWGAYRKFARKSRFDFYGVLGAAAGTTDDPKRWVGRAVYMEAKATGSRSSSLRILAKDQTGFGVKEHQLNGVVEAAKNFGALSAIVFRNADEVGVLLPDRVVAAHAEFHGAGRKSIPAAEFVPVPVKSDGGLYIVDWLEPVREWLLAHEERKTA